MTKEEWGQVNEQLDHAYGRAELMCDGYRLTLRVQRLKPGLRYAIAVYVGGWWRGEWALEDCEERRRFLQPCKAYAFKPKERARLKAMKPRMRKMLGWDPDKTITYYRSWWGSFDALRRHLVRNNKVVELAPKEEVKSA